jgi:hypothetical protein
VIDKATARPRFFMRANYDGQIMNLKRPGSNPADTLPVIMQYLEAQRDDRTTGFERPCGVLYPATGQTGWNA